MQTDQSIRRLEKAKEKMSQEGYTMLSNQWEGFRAHYRVRCPKGHVYSVQWAEYHRGTRCRKCHVESLKHKNPAYKGKTREEYRKEMDKKFKESLASESYSFDSKFEYKNNQAIIAVTCPQNHKFETNWNRWSSGKRCRKCFEERVVKSSEEINKELELEGCKLIGKYHGADKPFKYICSCGNKSTIRIGDFRRGVRCARCAGDRVKETLRLKRVEELKEFEKRYGNG